MWPPFKRILEYGSDPPRDRLNEVSRTLALYAALLCGNQKSAKKDTAGLEDHLIDNVTQEGTTYPSHWTKFSSLHGTYPRTNRSIQ
jgi:hypothetical protein